MMRDGTTEACHTVREPLLVLAVLRCCHWPWSRPHEKSCLCLGSLKKGPEDTIHLVTNILQLVSSETEVPVGILLQTSSEATGVITLFILPLF